MTSCGSTYSSYNAPPPAATCHDGGEKDDGSADREHSGRSSSPCKEMDPALALSANLTTRVDPTTATPVAQARKKRSYEGGLMGGSVESLNGKHVLGGSVRAICPRDRLQRHRLQVAGTVCIPEAWCGEARLREWVSSCDVEEALQPPGLFMARAALITARRSSSPSTRSPALMAPPAPPASWEVSLLS